MDAVALVVSIAAFIVAGFSVWYTRHQAVTEANRLRDERTPVFVGRIETVNQSKSRSLHMSLSSSRPLVAIEVEIVHGDGVAFTHSQTGVDPSADSPIRRVSHGELQPGDSAVWLVDIDDKHSDEITLRVRCRGDAKKDRWTVAQTVEVPRIVRPQVRWV